MDKSNKGIKEESIVNSHNRENILVVSIDKNGKIIQFNKECEKLTGYNRYEALNKEFFDFLIPKHYLSEWGKLFDLARRDKIINNLKLPWLTRQGHEIMVSWSSFPVEEVEGEIEDICLVGKLIIPDLDSKESLLKHIKDGTDDRESIIEFIKAGIDNKVETSNTIKRNDKDETVFNLGNKRIIFKKSVSNSPSKANDKSKKTTPTRKEEIKKPIKAKSIKTRPIKTQPVETFKEEKIIKSEKPLLQSFPAVNKIIDDLEKKNKHLEKENKKLEKDIKSLKTRLYKIKIDKKSKGLTLLDTLGGKPKQEEFENMIHELEERKSLLDTLETQLTKEKEEINKQKNEFIKWREKLESLEDEIENRRKELVDQERIFNNRFTSFAGESVPDKSAGFNDELDSNVKIEEGTSEHHEILDKIQDGAIILHRGILKQVNRPFVELLGYNIEELLEKSLLDFVVQEGFSGIEDYYLNRLKGESVSSFETVFLTKNDNKLAVEVTIKPTIYNDEKAEIAVIRNLEDKRKEKDSDQ